MVTGNIISHLFTGHHSLPHLYMTHNNTLMYVYIEYCMYNFVLVLQTLTMVTCGRILNLISSQIGHCPQVVTTGSIAPPLRCTCMSIGVIMYNRNNIIEYENIT